MRVFDKEPHTWERFLDRRHFLETKKSPDSVSYQGLLNIKLDDDLLSHGISHTTIGDGAFHF